MYKEVSAVTLVFSAFIVANIKDEVVPPAPVPVHSSTGIDNILPPVNGIQLPLNQVNQEPTPINDLVDLVHIPYNPELDKISLKYEDIYYEHGQLNVGIFTPQSGLANI